MEKIRTQFLVLLILVMVVFAGVVLMESIVNDHITVLYNLEARVNTVLFKWTRLIGQSSGLLASGDPIETVHRNWKQAFEAYQSAWQKQVNELAALAQDDVELQDQVSWVRSTLGMGVGEMTYLEENLDKLVAQLRLENGDTIARISLASLGDVFSESISISPGVRSNLFRVRDSARFFDHMIGNLGSSQQRFEKQTTGRILQLKDRLTVVRLIFLVAGVVILLVFLLLILRLSDKLMGLVQSRTNDLFRAVSDLQSTQKALTETRRQAGLATIIVGISHEINTPLGILTTAITRLEVTHQEIAAKVAGQSVTKQQLSDFMEMEGKLLGLGTTSIDRIRELLKYFRSLDSNDEGFSYSRFRLAEYLRPCMELFAKEAARHGHSLHWDCDETLEITSSGQAIYQVIRQLLDNSLDFAFPAGRKGEISLRIDMDNQRVRLTYHDDGIGLPGENADKIFDPFFTTGRNTKHIGLGLNIVYNLVAHFLGGSIALDQQSSGATFIILLPLTFNREKQPLPETT